MKNLKLSMLNKIMCLQMQLPVAEDLLKNIEGFTQAIGDVLMANSTDTTDSNSVTIERDNIGKVGISILNNDGI